MIKIYLKYKFISTLVFFYGYTATQWWNTKDIYNNNTFTGVGESFIMKRKPKFIFEKNGPPLMRAADLAERTSGAV